MGFTTRNLLVLSTLGWIGLSMSLPAYPAARRDRALPAAAGDSAEHASVLHLLNRITFGPRAGDVDRVLAIGWDRFINEQLHPESLDDSALEQRLASFTVLGMSSSELGRIFVEERRRAREARRKTTDQDSALGNGTRPGSSESMSRRLRSRREGRPRSRMHTLITQFQQAAVLRAAYSERQLFEVMVDFWTNHFNVFIGKGADRFLTPEYIEHTIRPNALGRFEDLLAATARSPAMLFYLDNVQSVAPGSEPPQLARIEQQMQRRRFANPQKSRTSRQRSSDRASRGGQDLSPEERLQRLREQLPTGLNENYARELLELHTLGVSGGYTQQDVIEVARVLTGWSVARPGRGGSNFVFNAWAHDYGEKMVLGRAFPQGRGMEEGKELLQLLARHPSTRRHVTGKLCARFVSDDPPAGCIDAGVRAWEQSEGNIREVVRAIIMSPEFWAPEYRGVKTKTPLEFVVSAVRALGAEADTTPGLAFVVAELGQPLFHYQPPTGYPESEEFWLNAGALLKRVRVAAALASGRVPGTTVDLSGIAWGTGDAEELVQAVNAAVLNGIAAPNTLSILEEQARGVTGARHAQTLIVALALGSPEFQRQ